MSDRLAINNAQIIEELHHKIIAQNERLEKLEEKLQYVIDNYLMEFEPALTKLKELEQKQKQYEEMYNTNVESFLKQVQEKLDPFKERQDTLLAVLKKLEKKVKSHCDLIMELEAHKEKHIQLIMELEAHKEKHIQLIMELEQKLGAYRTYQNNCSYNGDIDYKHDFLEKKVDTLSAVIKEHIKIFKALIDRLKIHDRVEFYKALSKLRKKLDGATEGEPSKKGIIPNGMSALGYIKSLANEEQDFYDEHKQCFDTERWGKEEQEDGEPPKKVIKCRSCGSPDVNYDAKEEFNCGCNFCGDVWNLKEEQEGKGEAEGKSHTTVTIHKEHCENCLMEFDASCAVGCIGWTEKKEGEPSFYGDMKIKDIIGEDQTEKERFNIKMKKIYEEKQMFRRSQINPYPIEGGDFKPIKEEQEAPRKGEAEPVYDKTPWDCPFCHITVHHGYFIHMNCFNILKAQNQKDKEEFLEGLRYLYEKIHNHFIEEKIIYWEGRAKQ